jgi:hypothetical protein
MLFTTPMTAAQQVFSPANIHNLKTPEVEVIKTLEILFWNLPLATFITDFK